MTPEEQALATVIDLLERHGIPYMVTGSIASSYYGRPRSTHDADIVIDPTPDSLAGFVQAVAHAGFHANVDGALRALDQRTLFNVIEVGSASKIDLIIRGDRPFSREEFSRRQPANFAFRSDVALVSVEDAILSKLEWARASGGSERQLADIRGMLEVTEDIDQGYLERWIAALGLGDLWQRATTRDIG